jgi:hypothetical protein
VSWTILAPVIDSITAQTGWQWTFRDAPSEPSKRVDVGRYDELVQMLSLIGE